MLDLFIYLDYRSYLRSVYEYKKNHLPRYSFAKMSLELGFKDRTFIQHILSGAKELPISSLESVVSGLGLNIEQAEYFETLLKFAHSKNAQEKEVLWKKIRSQSLTARNEVDMASQRVELLEFWYGFPIKDLLCAGIVDVKEIQKALRVKIGVEEIRTTIGKLVELGFVEQQDDGVFYDLEPAISTPTQEEFAQVVRNFQGQMQIKAKEALDYALPAEREFQTLSMSLSAQAFDEVVQVIRETRDTLIAIYENDEKATHPKNAIYQCNLSFFPIADLKSAKTN